MKLVCYYGRHYSPSIGRNLNLLSLGNVAGEQILVRAGISSGLAERSLLDGLSEIPFEDDVSFRTAARFGDLSVMSVAAAKSEDDIFCLKCDWMQSPDVDDGASPSTSVTTCMCASVSLLQYADCKTLRDIMPRWHFFFNSCQCRCTKINMKSLRKSLHFSFLI